MTTTDPQIALIKALIKAQAAFPAVEKKRTAKVFSQKKNTQYTYQYANIDDVISLTRKPLRDNGLVVSQPLVVRDGKTILATTLTHEGGGAVLSEIILPVENLLPQEVGSLLTYYRRYAMSALLGISSEADDDGAMAHSSERHVEGFMNITTVKAELTKFAGGLEKIKSDEPDARIQLEHLKAAHVTALEQAPSVLSSWWETKPGSDRLGIHDRILTKENEITAAEMASMEGSQQ